MSAPLMTPGPSLPPPADDADPAGVDGHGSPGRRTRPLGWGLALIGLGVTWMLELSGVAVPWRQVLPGALVVVGVLLLLGGAERQDGLIGLGIAIAVIALILTAGPVPMALSAGQRTYEVTEQSDLEASYALGLGDLTLDLRDLGLAAGVTSIAVDVGLGELVVLVPPQVTVAGEARVGMGEAVVFDRAREGIAPSIVIEEEGASGGPVLELDLQVGLGSLEVRR